MGESFEDEACKYFRELFEDQQEIDDTIKEIDPDYTYDIERAIQQLSCNKATWIDEVPAEWIKKAFQTEEFKDKIINCIKHVIEAAEIPKFWAQARLVKINKTKKRAPNLSRTRSISILPHIMKVLEISIISIPT